MMEATVCGVPMLTSSGIYPEGTQLSTETFERIVRVASAATRCIWFREARI